MAEPIRRPDAVLVALKAACDANPDQRVMQVVVNALGTDPFYVEDCDAVLTLSDYVAAQQTGDNR